MSGTSLVFLVPSSVDLGFENYYLDQAGLQHILIGHRDLRNFVVGIEDTVRSPTHVYRSPSHVHRFQFLSQKVVSHGGKPMCVIIEQELRSGRVVTASFRGRVTGALIWDASAGFYASYDKRSDILYFSVGGSSPAYAGDDEDDQVWFRYFETDESPAGVTLFQASEATGQRRSELVDKVAEFLRVDRAQVDMRWSQMLNDRQ